MTVLGNWWWRTRNQYGAVTGNKFTNIDEIIKINALVHDISSRHYIDYKIILQCLYMLKLFLSFNDGIPLNLEKKFRG
jgi:hypothetical protein